VNTVSTRSPGRLVRRTLDTTRDGRRPAVASLGTVAVTDIGLLCVAGLIGGFVNSIAGGGSLVLFPALVATGVGSVAANVTNSVALWPGYIGTLVGLGSLVHDQASRARTLAPTAAVAAAAGCALLLLTPQRAFDVVVPILVIGASLLVAAQPVITRRLSAGEGKHRERPRALLIAVGVASVYGGYFGGGLGVILLAAIGLTLVEPLRQTNALKSIIQVIVATVSLVAFVLFAPVHWLDVAIAAPSALLGGLIGGRFVRRVDERLLRIGIVVFGLLVGTWLAVRAVRAG
jgi:uncharacterized protein